MLHPVLRSPFLPAIRSPFDTANAVRSGGGQTIPVNLTPPVITGTLLIGSTLTATPGVWSGADSVTGEWYVAGIATGNTTTTYIIQPGDAGKDIEYIETATNSAGSDSQASNVITATTLLENVIALYANGEQGALYYLTEDFAGLYQDAAGTTPVTAVGQPVGLMLDRRFGLVRGAEENPTLDATGWTITGGAHFDNGVVIKDTATSGFAESGVSIVAGKTYELKVNVLSLSGSAGFIVRTGPPSDATVGVMPLGMNTLIFTAPAAGNTYLRLVYTSSLLGSFSFVSIREIPGNHASQSTAAARPLIKLDGNGKLWRDFDAVDDMHNTTFPDLGSDATIARAIPSVGAQILTGQTIGAGVWADSTDSNALAIIDRALTPDETAALTAWLNQQSGVTP